MKTIVYKISETEERDWLKAAGDVLAAGGLVGIPTETVYGLAANALDAEAAGKNHRQWARQIFPPFPARYPDFCHSPSAKLYLN